MAGYGWGVVYRPQQWSSLLAEGYKTVMNVNYRDMGAIMPRQLATLCLVQLVCNLKKSASENNRIMSFPRKNATIF